LRDAAGQRRGGAGGAEPGAPPRSAWRSALGEGRLGFWLRFTAGLVVLGSVDRGIAATAVYAQEPRYVGDLLWSLPVGALDDVATAAVLGLPFLGALYLVPSGRHRWRRAAQTVLFVMLCVFILLEVAAIPFWMEFDGRLNRLVLDYLQFPAESFGFLLETFQVGGALVVVLLLATLAQRFAGPRLARALRGERRPGERRRVAGLALVLALACYPLLAAGPVRTSPYREVNEVAINPLHNLARSVLLRDDVYAGLYPTLPEAEAEALLRASVAAPGEVWLDAPGDLLRRRVPGHPGARALNVVLVIEEGLGSTLVDGPMAEAAGGSLTPRFRRLAREGLYFSRVYATGSRTVRGLEGILTSFPPIPGISTSRRSQSDGMHSLPAVLARAGYETAFLYAGRQGFDDMGRFWRGIGLQQVWDIDDVRERGYETTWGVADEYLFTEAIRRLDERSPDAPPFFLGMLTVSNHIPFTFPQGRVDAPPGERRLEHSARYADWALADFIERARGHAWFDDTVFVVVADHQPRVHGGGRVPVPSYRVPLLFYAPGHVAPREVATVGSSIDVAPTLLGLLGLPHEHSFFGRDLQRIDPAEGRALMEHNHAVAYTDGREVAVLVPWRRPIGYRMRPGREELAPTAAPDPDLLRRAQATYQTAHRLFYGGGYHRRAVTRVAGAPERP